MLLNMPVAFSLHYRGVSLELLLTKLQVSRHRLASRPQIICMSATMSRLEAMCSWLDARLFLTNYRPVPLREHAVFDGQVMKRVPLRGLPPPGGNADSRRGAFKH